MNPDMLRAAAIIGGLLSMAILQKLSQRQVFSDPETIELLDGVLLMLEKQRALYPQTTKGFDLARATLEELLDPLRQRTYGPPPPREPRE